MPGSQPGTMGAAGSQTAPPQAAPDLETLFRQYYPRIFAYVRYRIADVNEAEDLTSEILERALTHLASFDARKAAFSTWLFRIAHNMFVNHVKKRQYRARHQADLNVEDQAEYLPDRQPSPEQAIVQQETMALVLDSLSILSARQQEILSLRFAGRLTNREIAHVLRMNERTVSVTILRALRKLRQHIGEDMNE